MKYCNPDEFYSKRRDEVSGGRDDRASRQNSQRVADAARSTSTTTTTALTRTTTTTVALPDESATASPAVNREPPIIVLQEAPVAPTQHDGLLDAAAAAIWIERQRTMRGSSLAAGRTRVSTDGNSGNSPAAPMSRRQRLNRRRHRAATTAAASGPWNDPLTGVLLCPEALEHIVVHSSIVPDPGAATGSSGVSGQTQSSK